MVREDRPPESRTLTVLRDLRGWDQHQLAAAAGLSEDTISAYERGKLVPSLKVLLRLAGVMGQPESMVHEVLLLATYPAKEQGRWVGPVHFSADQEREIWARSADIGRRTSGAQERWTVKAIVAATAAADRRLARQLWVALKAEASLAQAIVDHPEYQIWSIAELLCEESIRAAAHRPDRALELARAALLVASLAPGEEKWRQLVLGSAHGHVGNAQRVREEMDEAREQFQQCRELWEVGRGGDPVGILNEGRVFGLEASMCREEGRFTEALDLLARGVKVSNPTEKGYLLVSQSKVREEMEDYEGAIASLRAADPLIGVKRSRLFWTLRFDLLVNLCNLERFAEVQDALPEVKGLTIALENALDLIRFRWLEGRIEAGTGCLERAVATLSVARADFLTHQLPYDAALVTMDLAAVLLDLGRLAQVKALALQMAPIFKSRDVHANAKKALTLFQEAALAEAATIDLVRKVARYLRRARRVAHLKFVSAEDSAILQ